MLQASSLATLDRIRHAFFTRSGGVSQGVYASLNGGVGSNDAPDKVAENRARMAATLGVNPDRLLTPYQIHSPDVVVADKLWTRENCPRGVEETVRLGSRAFRQCRPASVETANPMSRAPPLEKRWEAVAAVRAAGNANSLKEQ